jgi:hypothetical protein
MKYDVFLLVVYLVLTLDLLLISRLHFLLKKKVLNYLSVFITKSLLH